MYDPKQDPVQDPKPTESGSEKNIPDPQHWWKGVVQKNKYKAERWAKFIVYDLADNFYFPNPTSSCQVTSCLIHSSPFKTLPFNHNHQYSTAKTLYLKFKTNIPRNETERPRSQFLHPTFMYPWAIYIFPRLVRLFCCSIIDGSRVGIHTYKLLGSFISGNT